MNIKILIQIFLFLVILAISIIFYNIYFVNKSTVSVGKIVNNETLTSNKKESNFMNGIEYLAEDIKGSKYLIRSKFGEVKDSQTNLIFLKEVQAIISFDNSPSIEILSDSATYNGLNYNTNFYGNVLTKYADNNISSNNLDLYFDKNLVTISDEVYFKNLNTTLQADKVEINLLTKNSKIFMNNKFKKIKIINQE
tara:strand:- start:2399 stop:2983 length:585 start_codon:yes stop_codon:yes gene_type:complete